MKYKNADEYFNNILSTSTPTDVLSEYYLFLKTIPTLLNNELSEQINEVKKSLKIEDQLKLKTDDKINIKGDQHPILDALSFKLGYNVKNWLAPPTVECLLCGKNLLRNHKPSQVVLHTQMGPEMATKYIWECRTCTGIFTFNNKFQSNKAICD